MALSEFEETKVDIAVSRFVESRRPRKDMRHQVDLGYRIENQSVVLFEIRPHWNNPKEKIEGMVAKATYIKSDQLWRVFWQRADLRWHRYEPAPEVKELDNFLNLVDKDEYACFWG